MKSDTHIAGVLMLTAALTAGMVFCGVNWPERWPLAVFWLVLVVCGLVWAWIVAGRM